MMPQLRVLQADLRERILSEAFALLQEPGVRVHGAEGLDLLGEAGADIDRAARVARIPESLARRALATAPHAFVLVDAAGAPAVHYGGDAVHFDPGSAAVRLLDPRSGEKRPAVTDDLIRLVKVAEGLPELDAQSTALVCSDVPQEIADSYRLLLVLLHSARPIVTGAFSLEGQRVMLELLAIAAPAGPAPGARAVFDVCPSPPLTWSEFATGCLIALARAGVPAEIVSMPLAGATAPATLAGAVVQHAAECLSGITLHQIAAPGAPIVWGGAPAIFDMRSGTTPMGAMETALIDAAYAEVGKSLGLPTHAYLGASDSKILDAQAGMESGMTALVGALAGINMISGAGMLDFLACQSLEKLVIDAEGIGMTRRLLRGIEERERPLATHLFALLGHRGAFLELKHTRDWFQKEQRLPSAVIDRGSVRAWEEQGRPTAADRARQRVGELLERWRPPAVLHAATERGLQQRVEAAARAAGCDALPLAGRMVQA
jgi:trimethylamine:corrinoid methyltransferase-like protein